MDSVPVFASASEAMEMACTALGAFWASQAERRAWRGAAGGAAWGPDPGVHGVPTRHSL